MTDPTWNISLSLQLLVVLAQTLTLLDLCACYSASDEDDALYEKLSGEQWRLECLMQLLAQLKDSDVPGAFFLDLLQVQTQGPTQRWANF